MAERLGDPIEESLIVYPLLDSIIKRSQLINFHIEQSGSISPLRLQGQLVKILYKKAEKKMLSFKKDTGSICIRVRVLEQPNRLTSLINKRVKVYFTLHDQIYYFYSAIIAIATEEDLLFLDLQFPYSIFERRRRIAPRILFDESLQTEASNLLDLSISGFRLKQSQDQGLRVAMIFKAQVSIPESLPPDPERFITPEWRIRVVWLEALAEGGIMLGCEFVDLAAERISEIQKYIVRIQKYKYLEKKKAIPTQLTVKMNSIQL